MEVQDFDPFLGTGSTQAAVQSSAKIPLSYGAKKKVRIGVSFGTQF